MAYIFTPYCKFSDYETDISSKPPKKSLRFD